MLFDELLIDEPLMEFDEDEAGLLIALDDAGLCFFAGLDDI